MISKLVTSAKPYRFVRLLDKMIALNLFKTSSAVLAILVTIIVSRKFIKILALAIDGVISGQTALDILGLRTLIIIVSFFPAAIFVGILMVLGKMYQDQEMAAIASAGGGARKIYQAVFLCMLPLSMVAASLSLYIAPWAEERIIVLTSKDMETADLRGIAAGRFTEYSHGDLVFYTESIDAQLRMQHIFIQDRLHGEPNIITAHSGYMTDLPTGKYVILENGAASQGKAGSQAFILESFKQYAVRIDKQTNPINYSRASIPTPMLVDSEALLDKVELQKRFSTPLGMLFLSFLAVPLAKLSPRGGVYGSLIFAFLIYFIYGNINQINYSWMLKQTIPLWLGYIWVYGLMAALGCVFFIRLYGFKWLYQQWFVKEK